MCLSLPNMNLQYDLVALVECFCVSLLLSPFYHVPTHCTGTRSFAAEERFSAGTSSLNML